MRRLAFGLAAVIVALAVPRLAAAGTCASTCGSGKRICQMATVTAFRTCCGGVKSSKATGRSLRDAIHNCRDARKQARQTCVASLHDCLHACAVPPANSCQVDCLSQGRMCVQGVVVSGQTCVKACSAGPDRLQCLEACASQAQSDLAQCKSALQSCLQGCLGSPGGAFLD